MNHVDSEGRWSGWGFLLWDNPLARLEMAVANRSMIHWIAILVYALAALGLGLLPTLMDTPTTPAEAIPVNRMPQMGRRLFWIFFSIQALIVLFLVLRSAGKAIYQERQLKTWHMLFMSRMTPSEIIFGKLAGAPLPFRLLLLVLFLKEQVEKIIYYRILFIDRILFY